MLKVTGSTAIRGTRVGAGGGPAGESERGETAPRRRITYYCANGHVSNPSFVMDVATPETWDCRCGLPAGQDPQSPPELQPIEPYKSHLAYVQERRSEKAGNDLLEEALAKIRTKRGES